MYTTANTFTGSGDVFGGAGMDSVVAQALPDSLVWRSELAFNEPYVEYYSVTLHIIIIQLLVCLGNKLPISVSGALTV
jgi:hypothetical protein